MSCDVVLDSDGHAWFICGGERFPADCSQCGGEASRLCDGVKESGTCDLPLCVSCSTVGSNFKDGDHRDYCRNCAHLFNVVRLPPRPVIIDVGIRDANALLHRRDMEACKRMRRRCPFCPGRSRATHVGRANGLAMMSGCEWHVRMWVRDPLSLGGNS